MPKLQKLKTSSAIYRLLIQLRSFRWINRDNILLIVLNYNLRLCPILSRQDALNYPLARSNSDLRALQVLAINSNGCLAILTSSHHKVVAAMVRDERYLVNKMLCLQFARAGVCLAKVWITVQH